MEDRKHPKILAQSAAYRILDAGNHWKVHLRDELSGKLIRFCDWDVRKRCFCCRPINRHECYIRMKTIEEAFRMVRKLAEAA